MHELSLYAQIPSSRHEQVLSILAGLCATQPASYLTRTAIVSPLQNIKNDPNVISKKKSQGGGPSPPAQQTVTQLNQPLAPTDFGNTIAGLPTVTTNGAETAAAANDNDATTDSPPSSQTWTHRALDLPEPETKTVILRRVAIAGALTPAQAATYGATTRLVAEYVTEGHVLVHNAVVLRLYRVLRFPPAPAAAAVTDSSSSTVEAEAGRGSKPTVGVRTRLPSRDDMALLDPSGAFVLEAVVAIEDRGKPALVQAGMEQLGLLKGELAGAVELRVPERLALDTRVRF